MTRHVSLPDHEGATAAGFCAGSYLGVTTKPILTIMTAKDYSMIRTANKMKATQWDEVSIMADRADTDEAREILERRARYLYHCEEASAGCL